ncbi:MAG TPA: histidine kinase [Gammaproteobacteria bacterium]|nr:histidine kinase [Gammaproteobacteria bacterium]
MPAAALPVNEAERLSDLRRYAVLDTPPDPGLDALTQFARQVADTPIALISLTDDTRQWFKSRVGLDVVEIPRDWAPCAHAVATGENIVCTDMRLDPRFADNPLVRGPPHLRFYAGMALVTPSKTVLGTLAVIDTVPRTLSASQQEALALIARQIVDQLELRTAYRELAALRAQEHEFEARLLREKAEEAQRLAAELHDGVGQELVGISMLVGAALRHARADSSPLAGRLTEIDRLLRATIETCRSTAQQQGGFLLRKEGLGAALGRLARRLELPGAPTFVLEQESETPIECVDELTLYHLYRIAGEAIANAFRHSEARTVRLRTHHANGCIGFEVEDDGIGENVGASPGVGKSIMAYRARAIGAQLDFAERASGGVQVRCRLACGCTDARELGGAGRELGGATREVGGATQELGGAERA